MGSPNPLPSARRVVPSVILMLDICSRSRSISFQRWWIAFIHRVDFDFLFQVSTLGRLANNSSDKGLVASVFNLAVRQRLLESLDTFVSDFGAAEPNVF